MSKGTMEPAKKEWFLKLNQDKIKKNKQMEKATNLLRFLPAYLILNFR